VQDCHDLLAWLVPVLDGFPRARRFGLGERIEATVLDVLEALLEAAYSRDKQAALRRANLRLEVARHLWRLCFELKAIAMKRYEHGARRLDGVGRQIGGWLRASTP
jgi:hypothetical protein